MDELNKLKDLWDKSAQADISAVDGEKLREMLGRKSHRPLDKLLRSLWLEIIAGVLFTALLCYIMVVLPVAAYRYTTLGLILIFVGTLAYITGKITTLRKDKRAAAHNLRDAIAHTIETMELFTKTYMVFNMVFLPFGLLAGYLLGYGLGSSGNLRPFLWLASLPWHYLFLGFLAVMAVIGPLFWIFLKFYMRKLYGGHLQKLRNILRELDEE